MELRKLYQILIISLFIGSSHSTTVSLTVEGGASLVGPHCPGTVRLFCEGFGLTYLGWTYNQGENIIDRVEVDSRLTFFTAKNPAFVSVNITNITYSGFRTANFSSIMTVNLLELNKFNIRNISCGDLSNKATQQVNITDFFTSNVTVSYQLGILNVIKVQLYSICPEYNRSPFVYKISISASNNSVETRTCVSASCSITFAEFPTNKDLYNLRIMASNHSHNLKEFNFTVAYQSDYYLLWTVVVNSRSCQQFTVQCMVTEISQNITTCDIRHRTDDDNTLNSLHLPINTQQYLPYVNPEATHYFELSTMLKHNLLLVDAIRIEPYSIGLKGIIILAVTTLFLLMALTHLLILFLGAFSKSTILTSTKVAHISIAVILFMLVLTCAALLFVFGITANDTCTTNQEYFQNIMPDIMVSVVSTGIILVVLTWAFMSYRLYKYKGKMQYEGACHTLNEVTSAKCTGAATKNRPPSESMSMSNHNYHRGFAEMPAHNCKAQGGGIHSERSRRQRYNLLDYSKDNPVLPKSISPNISRSEYAELNKETMDDPEGPDHYMKPIAEEWPMPVLDRAKHCYSNIKLEIKSEEAATISDVVSDHTRKNKQLNYTGLSECYILENPSPRVDSYNLSPSRNSFYESVDIQSESDYQIITDQYEQNPRPLRPIFVIKRSKQEPIEEENYFSSQQQSDIDYQNCGMQYHQEPIEKESNA